MEKNIKLNITAIFEISQVKEILPILKDSKAILSIFSGRIFDIGLDAVKVFGSSTICITIETLKINNSYKIYTDSGRTETNIDTFEWIKEVQDLGVGEIILTSINNEGTGKGFDINLYEKASKICKIPLLAHGGAKNPNDVYNVFSNTEVDGAIIASAFHFNYYKELLDKKKIPLSGSTSFLNNKNDHSILFGINNLKEYLKSKKIEIR